MTGFSRAGTVFHLCTPENHPVVFTTHEDFKHAMTFLALAFSVFAKLKVYAFQIMSNHVHIVVSGDKDTILEAFKMFRKFLKRYLSGRDRESGLKEFIPELFPVTNLESLRNVIAYVNRNGFVVNPDETPYSYPWGTSFLYFNPEARLRHTHEKKDSTMTWRRSEIKGRFADEVRNVFLVDGYASPLSFCRIDEGEGFFRDAHHYFYKISKNQEENKEIAGLIGEKIFYTDTDLFSAILAYAKEKYGAETALPLLPADKKRELAMKMHHEYNAGNKQIARMLKLDINYVDSIFPQSAKSAGK